MIKERLIRIIKMNGHGFQEQEFEKFISIHTNREILDCLKELFTNVCTTVQEEGE